MKKSILGTAVIIAATGLISPQYAFSFGLPSLLGGGNSGGADLSASQTQTVGDYVAASNFVLNANIKMAKALRLKNEVAKLQATAKALKDGTSEESIKNSDLAISGSTASIAKKLKSNPKLSAASKKEFSEGLINLTAGGLEYAKVSKDLASSSSTIGSASALELLKLGELIYIAKSAPTNIKNFAGSLSTAMAFAKSQNIPIPANAADATSALGAL